MIGGLAAQEAKALAEPGVLTAALNWYRAIPLSDLGAGKKVTVPARDYVVGEYRFELLQGSHWILDEQPDKMADLLLDWFAAHPGD